MDAKLLYAFFLDRVSLSIKNGWIDNQGRVFIYYSIKNICADLNCGTQKACKLLDELEKVGALERKRQGLERPNKLYLRKTGSEETSLWMVFWIIHLWVELEILKNLVSRTKKRIFVDTNISVEILHKISDENHVLIMLADPNISVQRFFERPDKEKQFLYQLLLKEDNPEDAMINFRECLKRVNSQERYMMFQKSGFT